MSAFALVGIAGHQQDGYGRIVPRHAQRERDPVHDRHANVSQQKVELPSIACDDIQRIAAIALGLDLMTVGR